MFIYYKFKSKKSDVSLFYLSIPNNMVIENYSNTVTVFWLTSINTNNDPLLLVAVYCIFKLTNDINFNIPNDITNAYEIHYNTCYWYRKKNGNIIIYIITLDIKCIYSVEINCWKFNKIAIITGTAKNEYVEY